MKKIASFLLALAFCFVLFIPQSASAEGVQYGQLFGVGQPIVVDWSSYASVGKKCRVTLTDLRSKSKQVLRDDYKSEKIAGSWTVYNIAKKASYSVTVEVLDENGFTTKTVTDYFHVGDFVANPPEEPKDKLIFAGLPLNNQPYTSTMWSTWNAVRASNPAFANSNCDSTPMIWVNSFINAKYPIDALNILLLKSRVGGYKVNLPLEADLFKKANLLRAEGGKKPLLWSNNLGRLNRLRAVALCDEIPTDPPKAAELNGIFSGTYAKYNMRCGDGVEYLGFFPGANVTAASIMKVLQNDNKFMTGLLSDRKFGAIAAIATNKLAGKREKGVAVLAVFVN